MYFLCDIFLMTDTADIDQTPYSVGKNQNELEKKITKGISQIF